MQLESRLTCPHCAHQVTESMPTDACQFFYECKGCGVLLRPLEGDCCVFCSYGTNPCPPIQAAADGSEMGAVCCGVGGLAPADSGP
ncbi:GDCCVxC domain-containing (seleno)protein [Bosea vaviloviae]|uniref:GDCCVxC domain-containing (seleno)protein n=1 Tax=Bosea vaviloviae TaxID=1526658 RepID=UPI0011DF2067|nr:GDCCVxC domain-containing (seleno)protein [Bosea vaviloviae]